MGMEREKRGRRPCDLEVGLLDLRVCRVFIDAEDLIQVPRRHHILRIRVIPLVHLAPPSLGRIYHLACLPAMTSQVSELHAQSGMPDTAIACSVSRARCTRPLFSQLLQDRRAHTLVTRALHPSGFRQHSHEIAVTTITTIFLAIWQFVPTAFVTSTTKDEIPTLGMYQYHDRGLLRKMRLDTRVPEQKCMILQFSKL